MEKTSPRLRGEVSQGGHSIPLSCDPGLGAGIGGSAVNGVRTELKWLPQGPQEEVPVLAGPASGASHQTAWCPPCYDRDGPDVVFLQPASLCCPVYPYLKTCGSSLHLQTEMASRREENVPIFVSSTSPSPDPSPYTEQRWRAFPLCTNLIISLGASGSLPGADSAAFLF